ncbi:MAG: sialidase family protein [Acidimicrobiia bacterium]
MRTLRLGLAAAAVVLLLTALWTPEPERGPATVGHNVVVNEFGPDRPFVRSNEAPDILVDRKNPDVVYLSAVELASGACRFYVSLDRGATWRAESAPRLEPWTLNCAMGSAQPQNVRTDLAQGPDGTLFYAFQGNDPDAGGTRSVLLGRSPDGGRSWETVVVEPGPRAEERDQAELNFQAHVAVDPDRPELVYVMWRRAWPVVDPAVRPRRSRPYFAVSQDGGASFGPPTQLLDVDLGSDGPRPVVVDGTVYAFYLQAAPPLPGGDSPTPAPGPPLARVSVAASSDRGRTWARSEIAAAPEASDPAPVWDDDRRLFHVVWHDNRKEELDVWFSSSPDGVTWTAPRQLNDDPAGTRVGQHFPQISVDAGGRIDVAWYDWRDDPFPAPAVGPGNVLGLFTNRGKVASVYLTSSRDGGRTWSPNVRVNDQLIDRTVGTWANNYDVLAPPAVASTGTQALVAWSDTRHATTLSQTQDIAAAAVTFERAASARVTGLQATLVGLLVGSGVAMWVALWLVRRPSRAAATGRRSVEPPAAVPK